MTDTPEALDMFEMPVDLEQIEYVVKHPVTGAPTAARILLAGITHPVRRGAMFTRMRTLMAEGRAEIVDAEAADEDTTVFVAQCTFGWSGLATGGVLRPFIVGAALVLYSDPKYLWLRDQVRDALQQRTLFISAAPTT